MNKGPLTDNNESNKGEWIPVPLSDIMIDRYVRCVVFTYSQKWMTQPGFECYNCMIEGRVVALPPVGERQLSNVYVRGDDGTCVCLGVSPGCSGSYQIWMKANQ